MTIWAILFIGTMIIYFAVIGVIYLVMDIIREIKDKGGHDDNKQA